MKLLFDQNISFRAVNHLRTSFPEIKHVSEFGLQKATDRQIWNYARENGYTIVTFDADFYDMVTLYGHPPKIIWLRIGNTATMSFVNLFKNHSELIHSFLSDSHYREISCLEIN